MISKFRELFKYRNLLINLTKKELKVKYRGSILGFFWSLLNPILMTLVYSFVFSVVMRAGIKEFAVFLISALLPWNFLANSINLGVGSVVGNSALVKKIYFPREILPLSIIFSNFVNFMLELVALLIFLAVMRYPFYKILYYLPLVIIVQIFLVVGMTLIVSSLNVVFRDIQHLVTIFMLVWFFGTPIIYPMSMVPKNFQILFIANPMSVITIFYRNMFYSVKFPELMLFPSLRSILVAVAVSILIFFAGYFLFKRLEPRFAEEI